MEAHERNRNPKYKSKYKDANWAEYEKNLGVSFIKCCWE